MIFVWTALGCSPHRHQPPQKQGIGVHPFISVGDTGRGSVPPIIAQVVKLSHGTAAVTPGRAGVTSGSSVTPFPW